MAVKTPDSRSNYFGGFRNRMSTENQVLDSDRIWNIAHFFMS